MFPSCQTTISSHSTTIFAGFQCLSPACFEGENPQVSTANNSKDARADGQRLPEVGLRTGDRRARLAVMKLLKDDDDGDDDDDDVDDDDDDVDDDGDDADADVDDDDDADDIGLP